MFTVPSFSCLRSICFWLSLWHPFFPCLLSCLVVCFLHLNLGLFAAGATLSFEKISDSPVDGLKSLKFLFLSLQISHVIRQPRYHSDRRPRRRPQGLKIYQRSVFNLTSKLFLLLFLRNHPFIGLQGPSKHQGLDLRERIKYRWTTAVSCAMAPKFPSGLGSPR